MPGVYSVYVEPRWPRFVQRRQLIDDLPEALEGLRLIQISDLHLGPFVPEALLRRVVEQCNELEPDLMILTGDYVYSSPRYSPRVAEILGGLEPRLATIGVLGNHDHWEGGPGLATALRDRGVRLVDNDRLWVSDQGVSERAPVEPSLCIAGVGDYWSVEVDLEAALAGVAPDTPRLLLSHNPDVAELDEAAAHRVDLMLSGHTHGGQVRLPFKGVLFTPSEHGERYLRGLVQGPSFPVYINPDLGVATLPARLGVRPEVTIFELHRRRGDARGLNRRHRE